MGNSFIREILLSWSALTFSDNLIVPDVNTLGQVLWNNSLIKIGGNVVFKHNWIENGITQVRHLLDEHGNFYSHTIFMQKSNVRCNFLEYYSLTSAIPKEWKHGIQQPQAESKTPQEELLYNLKKVCM